MLFQMSVLTCYAAPKNKTMYAPIAKGHIIISDDCFELSIT